MTRHKSRVARRSRHRARRGTRKQSGGFGLFGSNPVDGAEAAAAAAAPAAPAAAPAAAADASPGDKNSWWHSILGFFTGNNNGTPPGQVGGRKTRHRRRSPRRHRK